MPDSALFSTRFATCHDAISPAEKRVAQFLLENREEGLIASAASIAAQVGTSDATVVRTAKALGFAGLEDLRKSLAREIREAASPASRMARTIREVGSDLEAAFQTTLDINQAAIEDLRVSISAELFQAVIDALTDARRVFIFGIGPSGAMAEYLALELARLGLSTNALTRTGTLLADDMGQFRPGDMLVLFAYGQVYPEVTVLLDHATRCGLIRALISDSLGPKLAHRVDHILPVARGRVNRLSMHTATLALIEALIVGVATRQPAQSLASLKELDRLRQALRGPVKGK